jgi:head-tail adaptor
MTFDKPIIIQIRDDDGNWSDLWKLHARVNKSNGGQMLNAGADQYMATLSFDVRYFKYLEDMRYNPQPYRIVYRGHFFKLTDWDDYMEQHRTVRLTGEAYG